MMEKLIEQDFRLIEQANKCRKDLDKFLEDKGIKNLEIETKMNGITSKILLYSEEDDWDVGVYEYEHSIGYKIQVEKFQ